MTYFYRFPYGQPDQIFIRTILPYGHSLPAIKPNEMLQQNAPGVFHKTDSQGNITRKTHGAMCDSSSAYALETLTYTCIASVEDKAINGPSTEFISGLKTLEAMGAIKINSGGYLNLTGIDNINLTTSRDIQITVGQSVKERIGKAKISVAKLLQRVKVEDGGKIWIGNESDNVLQLLSDLMGIVQQLASDLATHKHAGVQTGGGTTQAPDIAGKFSQAGGGSRRD